MKALIFVLVFFFFRVVQASTLSEFRDFVIKNWAISASDEVLIDDMMVTQIKRLQGLIRSREEWQKKRVQYIERGQTASIQCVDNFMAPLNTNTAIAEKLIDKLSARRPVKVMTAELFDDLTRVGEIRVALTQLQDAVDECILESEMGRHRLIERSDVYSLSEVKPPPHFEFESLFPFQSTRIPFK